MKKIIRIIITIVLIFIISTITVSYYIINNNNLLNSFNLINVTNINTIFNIKYEKVKLAKYYEIVFYQNDNTVFYSQKTTNNSITINLQNIEYNQEYNLIVYAYDNNNYQKVNNPYHFVYNEPTFSRDNKLLLTNNQDYTLKINGSLSNKDYYITISDGNYVIKKERITSNEYLINKDLFSNIKQILKINLIYQNEIINSINLYSNISPISDLKINNPLNDSVVNYSDLNLTYTGGDNATKYLLEIYQDNKLIKQTEITEKNIVISKEFFKKDQTYKLIIKALYYNYDEYLKQDEVIIKISND